MQIEKEDPERGKGWPRYLITTKEEIERRSSFPVLSISQTGAITITIDPEGDIRMKGFIKESLPSLEGGS